MKRQQQELNRFLHEPGVVERKESESFIALPKITIVTPSYNQGNFLERTIKSVLNQNYPGLEYIIFDGASKDGSVEIIKKYQSHLAFWQSAPDRGQSHAIIKGFERSSGEVLGWLNSDDVLLPNALSLVGAFFKRHPEIDVVYGDSYTIDENDRILRETRSVKFNKFAFLTSAFSLHQASIFWRRAIYFKSRGVNKDDHLTLDRDLWLAFFQSGARFKHLPKPLACFRYYPATKTAQNAEKIADLMHENVKRRFGINLRSGYWQQIRKIMRARTFFYHLIYGNLFYLLRNAGKTC